LPFASVLLHPAAFSFSCPDYKFPLLQPCISGNWVENQTPFTFSRLLDPPPWPPQTAWSARSSITPVQRSVLARHSDTFISAGLCCLNCLDPLVLTGKTLVLY
jgi:hypothetical protein